MLLRRVLLAAALMLLLCSCGGSAPSSAGETDASRAGSETLLPKPPEEFTPYAAPPLLGAAFHVEAAAGENGALLDLSALADGYVAVSVEADARIKLQVKYGEETYNYDVASDGTPSCFPLQSGDGTYLFRVMKNVSESKYIEIYAKEADVKLKDGYQPFLRPSDYVNYSEDSACVQKARELAKQAPDALGLVGQVYAFVTGGVRYDTEKAQSVQSGYLPKPDETLATGQGICFDYAALAAAMLRSQGIPCKMIFGYVSPGNVYHAWNMFYTAKTGWVTVKFEVRGESWNRLDLTFAANGQDDVFIGDGSNYTDLFVY